MFHRLSLAGCFSFAVWAFAVWAFIANSNSQAQLLESELQRTSAKDLALAAREVGDAERGAVVFFQPQMACSKCHVVANKESGLLGPDLSTLDKNTTDESLVESVLYPSKAIRKGFESVSVLTSEGAVVSGLLVERTKEKVIVRDVSRDGELVTILTGDIDQLKPSELSIMPAGQMNQLNSRQQFFDLIRYLMEIRDGGAERAKQLQPAASLLVLVVPEYESHLDHAGLIGKWNEDSLKRGSAIYQRVCANCHGTLDQPGSLPTSLRFAEGKFKNGSDPLSMYRTMTHGFGLMAPQTWMVPSQKYDVIHFIRETYLKSKNPSQYSPIDASYLSKLPQGDTFGPEPSMIEPWSAMDYGPSLAHTFEVPGTKHNFAYKGIAVRLDPGPGGVSRGQHWVLFDTDTLRMAAGWNANPTKDPIRNETSLKEVQPTEEPIQKNKKKQQRNTNNNFVDWRGIQFNGEHGIHPRIVGQTAFTNSTGPGWADPKSGEFRDDQRVLGRDGKRYGPLPKQWGKFKGLYHHGQQVIFSYSIGKAEVLESPRMYLPTGMASPLLLRTFNVGPCDHALDLRVTEGPASEALLREKKLVGIAPDNLGCEWTMNGDALCLRVPASPATRRFTIWLPSNSATETGDAKIKEGVLATSSAPRIPDAELDLTSLTRGGPPRWSQVVTTQMAMGDDSGAFAIDTLSAPESNPWLALTRFTGLDFFDDGRIAISTWDGDVWIVTPAKNPADRTLQWRRIASGLFQPLGLKIIKKKIHLVCRDQLAVLHDLNGDEEIDYYECLNNDHQVTEHFHEFAMGLQTDNEGNFYYAKSGCHGKEAVVPHHGTLLKVSPDGSRTEILANGFRAANGVCMNPDGSFFVTDQEGFWNPKNRINWVTLSNDGRPKFYGNMLGYHDVKDSSDSAMEQPLCWITNEFDRSPAELLWVDSDKWGPLKGSLLNLSYGYGKVFLVPHEKVNGKVQGGMIELPIPKLATGVMRGRFHPADGQLYLCGMFAWAGNATHPGALYRLRATGKSAHLPIQLQARKSGLTLSFSEAIDPGSIDLNNLKVKSWAIRRTANYGSKHFDEKELTIRDAKLSKDGKSITIQVDQLEPTWCMEIKYAFQVGGSMVQGKIHNTIHELVD